PHEQGSANPVATCVRHENTEAVLAPHPQGEEIEAIAAHVLGGCGPPSDLEASEQGHRLGQQSLLDLLCHAAVGFLPAQLAFGLAALDKLTDLAADAGHHLNQLVVRLPDFPATELHDTEDFNSVPNQETHRSMQPLPGCEARTKVVGIRSYVGNPGGGL